MIKRENHISIEGWMITDLKLKGLDLMLYAVIFSFCRNGGDFHGSIKYLQEWTNSSRTGVYKSLNRLIDRCLIRKWDSCDPNTIVCYDYNPIIVNDILKHGSD